MDLAPWKFLLGEWEGAGGGEPGAAVGGFSFYPDLENHILVRRNRAHYAGSSHEDLLIVYGDQQAIYFDSEGHTIHYQIEFMSAGAGVQMVSAAGPDTPRYRLTMIKAPDEQLAVIFEIASPDQPDDFVAYTRGLVRRVTAAIS